MQDDSSSVKQEAINFLGAHIRSNPTLAVSYFDILAECLNNSAQFVKKAAVKIIWEACVAAEDSPKAVEACQLILQKAHEAEDAGQDEAVKFVHNLWIAPGDAGDVGHTSKSSFLTSRSALPH